MNHIYTLSTPLFNLTAYSFDNCLKEVVNISAQVINKIQFIRDGIKGNHHLIFTTIAISNVILFKLANDFADRIENNKQENALESTERKFSKNLFLNGIVFGGAVAICNFLFFKIIKTSLNPVVLGAITVGHVVLRLLIKQKAMFEKVEKNQEEIQKMRIKLLEAEKETNSLKEQVDEKLAIIKDSNNEIVNLKSADNGTQLEKDVLQKKLGQLTTLINQYETNKKQATKLKKEESEKTLEKFKQEAEKSKEARKLNKEKFKKTLEKFKQEAEESKQAGKLEKEKFEKTQIKFSTAEKADGEVIDALRGFIEKMDVQTTVAVILENKYRILQKLQFISHPESSDDSDDEHFYKENSPNNQLVNPVIPPNEIFAV